MAFLVIDPVNPGSSEIVPVPHENPLLQARVKKSRGAFLRMLSA
jgi:hypothetical protein